MPGVTTSFPPAPTSPSTRSSPAARPPGPSTARQVSGWFTEDFTAAELQTLFCRERQPKLRPQSARYDGKEPILTLAEVLAIARAGCVRTGRTIGVMPRRICMPDISSAWT